MTDTRQGAEATRRALISTALRLFGEYGYNAVSTRKIAELADANIGSIAYHFGGKLGLMRACARYSVETIEDAYGHMVLEPLAPDTTREEARRELCKWVPMLVAPVVRGPDAEAVHIFMLRNLSNSSDAFDLLYDEFLSPVHRRLRQLISVMTGRDADADETRLLAFTILGQCMYFKICRNVVTRNMQWSEVGESERAQIVSAIGRNVEALLDIYSVPQAS